MAYERFSLGRNKNLFGNPDEDSELQIPEDVFRSSRLTTPMGLGSEGLFPPKRFDPTKIAPEELPSSPKPSFADEYLKAAGVHPERDRLAQLMENAPTREQFKPNKLTRAGAILGGISAGWRDPSKGVELAQSTLDRPFNEASAEYDKKLRNVGALAGMESQDIQTQLEARRYGREDERDTRDYQFRQREFDARMEELKDKDWTKFSDEKTGRMGWTNRKTQETIYGPQENEPLSETRAREDQINAFKQKGAEKIAGMNIEGRNEVNEAKIEAQKAMNIERIKGALERLKYAPMSETQRAAGLKEKLQNIASMGINPFDYVDVDDSGVYTMNKADQAMTYGLLSSEETLARKKSERAIVQQALDSGKGISSSKTGTGRAGGTEIPIGNGFTLRKPG